MVTAPTRQRTAKEIWEIALADLQIQVSKQNFKTWFSRTTGISCQDHRFIIGTPNTFGAEYLEKNQLSLIKKTLGGLIAVDTEIIFQVNGETRQSSAEVTLPELEPVRTQLNQEYVFERFVEGENNRFALAAALSVSQNLGQKDNPLFIHSGPGLGKTHLIHAIGQAAVANHINVICTTAEQFMNEFVHALKTKASEEFRDKYRSIGLLLIDDIQFIAGKEGTEEAFFHTFNELHNTKRQIVLTSDCHPKSMPLVEERLRSRFEWGLVVEIQPPDYETRLAILRSKVMHKGISLSSDVLEFIAQKTAERNNVRVLEGNLNKVCAFAKVTNTVPTLAIASTALADPINNNSALTPEVIIDTVAGCFGITKTTLRGRERGKDVALARKMAMYFLKQYTNLSVGEIGQLVGKRDGAAVTIACQKIIVDRDKIQYIKNKIADIEQAIEAISK